MQRIMITTNNLYFKIYNISGLSNNNYTNYLADFSSLFNNKITLVKDIFRKPYIKVAKTNKLYPISISHSKETLIIMVATNREILLGIDVELKEISQRVVSRVTNSNEKIYIEEHCLSVSDIWMQKEAISKAIGSGLSMGLQNIDLSKKEMGNYCIEKKKINYGGISFYAVVLEKK